jgi:hypothetical protein
LADIAVRVKSIQAKIAIENGAKNSVIYRIGGNNNAKKSNAGRTGDGDSRTSVRKSKHDEGKTGRNDESRATDDRRGRVRGLPTDRTIVDVAAESKNPKFVEWFGKSRIITNKGLPYVLYHGTNDRDF